MQKVLTKHSEVWYINEATCKKKQVAKMISENWAKRQESLRKLGNTKKK